ncbi:MAG: 2-phospho-L-lactate guanylyltransferase [Methanosarcinales archaeon]|nr:2-phospho-L-lactate guanylyltransferase [Methanosarcinales archaeon]
MRAVIPFKKVNAKTRLSGILSENQRQDLALEMLLDVIFALEASGKFNEIEIINSSISSIMNTEFPAHVNVLISEKGLNEALNEYLDKLASHNMGEVLIIMADMPLVTKKQIQELTRLTADIVIVPGSGGGTNALLIRKPDKFHVDYYGTSFLDHVRIAKEAGLSMDIYDSFMMSTDIDEPKDLVELLIHGKGRAAQYLRSIGIKLDTETARLVFNN